jgi:hypothetical protein
MTTNDLTIEHWRWAYTFVWQIWDIAPWTLLRRSALIGVEQPQTGELGFVSITDDVAFPTISIYRNARGLYGFWYSHDMPLPDYPEQYLEIPQIRIDFADRAALNAKDLTLITQLGLTAKPSKKYPVFLSVQPGYAPWFLEADEVEFLVCVLEVLPRALLNPDLLRPLPPSRFPVRAKNVVKGVWRDTHISVPQPGSEPILFMMDQPLLAKVERLPHKPIEVEMDLFLVMGAPRPESDLAKRPVNRYMLLTVDAQIGLIRGHELLNPVPTLESMWGLVGWKIVAQFDKLGAIPKTVYVRSPLLIQVATSFSRSLEFTLKESKTLPGVDAAKRILDQLQDQ